MKRYKLLKDLPFAKAGEELYLKFSEDSEFFLVYKGTDKAYTAELNPEFIDNFDEWFEEIKEPKIFFTIDIYKSKFKEINTDYYSGWSALEVKNIKDLGLLFKTVEKTKKYLKYLKAKEIIKQDAKGFKPDWQNADEERYCGKWDFDDEIPHISILNIFKAPQIYFKSKKDIQESFKKHPEEWKTYLTYEQ